MKAKEQLKIIAWFLNGDVGTSSESIVAASFNFHRKGGISHPHDASDLGRCIKLLNEVPTLLNGLVRLAELDPHWKVLAGNWDLLKDAYYMQVGANESGDKSHDKVYDMMQEIFDKRQK